MEQNLWEDVFDYRRAVGVIAVVEGVDGLDLVHQEDSPVLPVAASLVPPVEANLAPPVDRVLARNRPVVSPDHPHPTTVARRNDHLADLRRLSTTVTAAFKSTGH